MWSLKVAPNLEFSRSASVRRDCETRVMGIAWDIRPRREKKERAGRSPPLQKPTRPKSGRTLLLRGFRFDAVVGQREARLVAVGGVLVQHVLGNGLVDCRHRGLEKIARGSGVAGGDGRAQAPHQCADPRAVGAVYFGALKRLRRALQNRLLLLLNLGSLSLGHLLLLLRIAQTSNGKRGSRLCQTSSKVGSVLISLRRSPILSVWHKKSFFYRSSIYSLPLFESGVLARYLVVL